MVKDFKRVEKKYLIDEETKAAFLSAISDYIKPDNYDSYSILNIYFDTDDDTLIRSSIEKPAYKEKLRLRSYGVPNENDNVFLELKKKYKGVVYKRRAVLPYGDAMRFIEENKAPEADAQLISEIRYFLDFYKPFPKLFLAYDREAYVGVFDSDLRITFDSNVRSRTDNLTLAAGDDGDMLLEDGLSILEIKLSNSFPIWLAHTLCNLNIYPTSFSKYGSIYKERVMKNA